MAPVSDRTCTMPDCDRKHAAKGLCRTHYSRLFKTGTAELVKRERPARSCTLDGCERKHCANGLCRLHYMRVYRTGSLELIERPKPQPRLCSAEGCEVLHAAQGLCTRHYQRLVNRGTTEDRPPHVDPGCKIEDCPGSHLARGWCVTHYNRWKRTGDPLWTRIKQHELPCEHAGCERRRKKSGLCELHSRRLAKGVVLDAPIRGVPRPCTVGDCDQMVHCNGMCMYHYQKDYRTRHRAELAQKCRDRYFSEPEDERRTRRAVWYQENKDRLRVAAKKRYDQLYPIDPAPWRAAKSRRKMRLDAKMTAEERHVSEDYRRAIVDDPCWYCGAEDAAHVDHFFPLAKGGTDHWWNLRRACVACNMSKHAHCGTWFLLQRGPLEPPRSVPAVAQAGSGDRRIAATSRFDTLRSGQVREDDSQLDLFSDHGGLGAA